MAEVRLEHDDLPLGHTLGCVPDVAVEVTDRRILESGRRLAFLAVTAEEYDAFESALRTDPTVDEPTLVDRYPDRRVYRVALTDRTMTVVDEAISAGGRVLGTSSCRDGWLVRLRLPSRDALVSFNDYCRERDVTLQVRHLRTAEDGDAAVVGLTAKQQALLTVAFEEGYFDVPREISQDELADRLDVSKSAISQRLRRAMAQLCSAALPSR